MYYNEKHKKRVEERGDRYTYIGSYHRNEETIDGKNKNKNKIKRGNVYIRVKCPYCGKEYDVILGHFNRGDNCVSCCNSYENSFAYYIQQELGEPLNKYWDWEKNDKLGVNPYYVTSKNDKKVYMKCIKTDYHESYLIRIANFYNGKRCPYCTTRNEKVHPKDSFGSLYPEKAKYWSKNNDKSPYEVTPHTHTKYKFICENCGSEFKRSLTNLNKTNTGVFCRECNSSQLEIKTKDILVKYNIDYKTQIKYEDLLGLGNGNLSYDFYLPEYNTLIECQGIQHKEWQETWITKDGFERQLEHDRRKKEYAKEHDIKLIEIWYNEINDIENILIEKLQIKNN